MKKVVAMGGKAKREKSSEKPFRNEPAPTRYKCPFPFCGKPFTRQPGTPDCCDAHRVMIAEHIFLHEHVKVRRSPGGLSLPTSNPQVDAALAEMREAAKREKKGG